MAETPEKVEVVMEVDVESLKPYFDNISEGFSDVSKALKNQRIFNLVLVLVIILTNVMHTLF